MKTHVSRILGRRARLSILAGAAVLAATLTGCGSATSKDEAKASGYPVTVANCQDEVTFEKAPERAVTTDVDLLEDMLALGLGDRIVGTFGVGDNGNVIGPEYRAEWEKLHHASDQYPTREALAALKPDFVFSGWFWGLDETKGLTPDTLAKFGAKTLVLNESCAYVDKSRTKLAIDDVFTDLTNLGNIFGVQDRAKDVIGAMRSRIADVQEKVKGQRQRSVFLYDSGEAAPLTAPALATPNTLITLAGGRNVFGDVRKSWSAVAWEDVVAKAPECILINDYGKVSAAQKRRFLETSPNTRKLAAVKNGCILALSYDQLTPGVRNVDAVESIAKWLYPDAF